MPGRATNGEASKRWESYTLKVLSLLFGVLSVLFWDMRREQTDLRRVSDQRTAAITKLMEHDVWIQEHRVLVQDWAIRLAIIEKQIFQTSSRLQPPAELQSQQRYQRFNIPGGQAPEEE